MEQQKLSEEAAELARVAGQCLIEFSDTGLVKALETAQECIARLRWELQNGGNGDGDSEKDCMHRR